MIGLTLIGAAALAANQDPGCDSTNLDHLLACVSEARDTADRELNQQWNQMSHSDAQVESQRAWIAWRDLECTARNAAIDGREGPVWQQACLTEMTEQRTKDLQDHYRWLTDADEVDPGGRTFEDGSEECDPSGKGDAGYRQCLFEDVTRSRERLMTALARNQREAAEEDANWAEHRRKSQFARDLDPTHLEALNRSQSAWEDYVEAQCTLEGYTALGGTAESDYRMRCLNRLNLHRLAELRSPFRLESQRLEPVPEE